MARNEDLKRMKSDEKRTKKAMKDHLKVMSKNTHPHHRIRTTGRILKYGTTGFGRNIWLTIASVLVMTITLLILFLTALASVVLASTADQMRQKIDINVFFVSATPDATLEEMAETMRADENVRSVTTSSSEDEYAAFLAENADNTELLKTLEEGAMRELVLASMPATMLIKVYDPDDLSSVKRIVESDPDFVKYIDANNAPTYESNQSEIKTISNWANIAKSAGLILGVVFLAISILVIFNTVRMAIFSRREEIYMMKLVGAENRFIRGPFLVEAEICGIIAGLLAGGLGYLAFWLISPKLEAYGIDISLISAIFDSAWLAVVILALVVIGVIIGAVSARLAIHKHLR